MNGNVKKISGLVCGLLLTGVLASCGGSHTHTFNTVWDKDAKEHWHAASCEHTSETADRGAHVDADKDNICDVCGYIDSHVHTYEETWTMTPDNHYHKATCDHTEMIKDEGKHEDGNKDGLCDVCAYDYDHTHTFATEWSTDETHHWYAVTCDHAIEGKDKAAHEDADENGACDTCAYTICAHTYANEWSADENNHWYAATCGCAVIKDQGSHADENKDGKCDTCAYVLCSHTVADAWSFDDVDHWHTVTCGCEVVMNRNVHTDENGDGACDICAHTPACIHTYGDAMDFDTQTHWYVPTCEHTDVRGAVAPHADADGDGACDVCFYTTRHTVTVTYPSYVTVTDANNNPIEDSFILNNDESKTLLITVPDTAVLAMVTGATQEGDVQTVNGGKVYTYVVGHLLKDVTVKVAANKLVSAEQVVEKEATAELNGMLNYGTITFDAPATGKYFIYDPMESGVQFGPAGSTTNSDYKNVYSFEVTAAGETTVGTYFFSFSYPAEMDFSYLICRYEDEFTMADIKGEGYMLPNNIVVKLTFVAPAPGRYQVGSTASNLAWGGADATSVGDMVQGFSTIVEATYAGEVITVTVFRESVAEVSFAFDWEILNLSEDTEIIEVTVGETPVTLPNGNYASVIFTVPADGSYTFAVSNFYSHIFLWMEEYEIMYDMGNIYTAFDAKAGDVITLFLSAVDDNMDGDDVTMTDDVEDILTVIDMSTVMGDDGNAKADADGEENQFMADYDGGDYIFTAPDGVTMSFDGGNTWVSEYTVTLVANQLITFLVKTADGAETATLWVEQIVYWLDLEATDNVVTHTFTMYPGKEYSLSVYGLNLGKVSITWGGADITAMLDGRPFAEGEVVEYSVWMNAVSLTLNSDAPVEVTLTVRGK